MNIWTIGFTQSSAERFFARLLDADVKRVVDVRLRNTSQLAGFAKASDLPFFLREICQCDYDHLTDLAPSDQMLNDYKKGHRDWGEYRRQFLDLMDSRKIESKFSKSDLIDACLLCSEAEPHHCHRSIVCEYLNAHWDGELKVTHL